MRYMGCQMQTWSNSKKENCKAGIWMKNILCPIKAVPQSITKRDILMNDLTTEARLWPNIIYSRISPCTYMTIVKDLQARVVAYILSGIPFNMGEIVLSKWRYFKNHGGTQLFSLPLSLSFVRGQKQRSMLQILGCTQVPTSFHSNSGVRVPQVRARKERWPSANQPNRTRILVDLHQPTLSMTSQVR